MPGPGGFRGGSKAKNAKGTLLRLFKFLFKYYKTYLIIVAVCILLSALAGTVSSLFLNQLLLVIGDGINTGFNSVSGRLMQVIGLMIGFYALGVITTFIYSQLMAVVTQGFLDKMRQNMFGSMQSLPIKYFDTHTHGDIMSYYTNDIDTLRQLISQSIPQLLTSFLTIVALLFYMLMTVLRRPFPISYPGLSVKIIQTHEAAFCITRKMSICSLPTSSCLLWK